MDSDRWHLITGIFDRARSAEPSERDALLDASCGTDAELRAEVEALLSADADGQDPIADIVTGAAESAVSREGQRIGHYRIVREEGRGGMGTVFVAERADGQFDQVVALKVLHGAGAPAAVEERFRQERQILANLEHPNIARLVDGGVTDDGLPYFAMEYVEGVPIDRYCDENDLSVDERLALFKDVCRAVSHAHGQLVIHRDLKPDNILATADGSVRLLDFGIAKVIDEAEPAATRTAMWALTPSYASPEQVRGEPVGVATDVYSLGVVLYELLTGSRPYEVDVRRPTEVERIVCDTEPVRPSTRVVTSDGDRPRNAADATRLGRRLSGDLDVIVMKALRKEPAGRYQTVQSLLDDLDRHTKGLPVLARPATIRYRLGKAIRRNRLAVGAAAAVVLTATSLVGFYTSRLAAERDLAQAEATRANEVADFLRQLFEVSDPSESLGETITARELLELGATRLDDLASQPTVHGPMLRLVGEVYMGLGLTGEAIPLLEQAVAVSTQAFGPVSEEVAMSQVSLAASLQTDGDIAAARPLFESALDILTQIHGPDDPVVADAMRQLAYWHETDGNYEAAEEQYRRALEQLRAAVPAGDPRVVDLVVSLGNLLRQMDARDEAEPLLREALAARRVQYGDRHPEVAAIARPLAALLRDEGQFEESEALYREVISIRREMLGELHPELATTLNSYALLLSRMGDLEGAIETTREFMEIQEAIYTEPHPSIAAGYHNLASLYRDAGRLEEAAELFRQSIDEQDLVFRPDHPNRAFPRIGLAGVYRELGAPARAEPLVREALDVRRASLPPDHRYVGEALSDLGVTLLDLGRTAEAEAALLEGLEVLEAAEDESRIAVTKRRLGRLYTETGDLERAARYEAGSGG